MGERVFDKKRGRFSLRFFALLCALLMLCTAMPLSVGAETPEERYERLKGELDVIAGQIAQAESERGEAEALRVTLQKEKSVIDELIAINKEEIELAREALAEKEEEIAEKRLALEETEALFSQRLVAIYQMNNSNALTSILSVNSFTEFLQMIDAMKRISEKDTSLMSTLDEQRTDLEAEQAEIDKLIEKLNKSYEELSGNASSLANNILAQDGEISENDALLRASEEAYGATAAEAEQAYQEMVAASNAVVASGSSPGEGIPGMEPTPAPAPEPAAPAEPEITIDENGQEVVTQPEPAPAEPAPAPEPVVGAISTWPVPSSRTITCRFGQSDPAGRAHRGMDIAAPYNTPIVAAGNGVVTTATSHSSYGNYLVIDHGNGLKTLYAHCNSLLVGVGTYVEAGTTVALMGSTGFSTGSHLHFEVYNPGLQDPSGYIGG
ncbi:peptidoglycan DD-metalloendopeptidase family protein [Ruminococcaceae bacterium OttesenSCG-928-I18]|nr:peptidoglycan DD-metalloendopeptidase family protein [Ruminococcaceae bacterium OttesenSCG-928-I18]